MSPELQKYYDKYFDLFASEGWKQFIEDVKKESDIARRSAGYLGTTDEFLVRKGEIHMYDWIENLPIIVDNSYKNAMEDSKDADI